MIPVPSAGVGVGVGVGEGVAKVVINRHVKSDDIALPAISFTPVVIFAVYVEIR